MVVQNALNAPNIAAWYSARLRRTAWRRTKAAVEASSRPYGTPVVGCRGGRTSRSVSTKPAVSTAEQTKTTRQLVTCGEQAADHPREQDAGEQPAEDVAHDPAARLVGGQVRRVREQDLGDHCRGPDHEARQEKGGVGLGGRCDHEAGGGDRQRAR